MGSGKELHSRIAVDQGICGGRPHIKGTRVRVSDIMEMVAAGVERRVILEDYPYITDEDITAAIRYAAHAVDHRVITAA